MYSVLEHDGSKVQFGGWDMKYANSSDDLISWNDVINTDYWTLELTSIEYDDKTITPSTEYAIVDSGTSIIVMPTDDFTEIYE